MTLEEREAAAASLTRFQRSISLGAGTERAFTGRWVGGSGSGLQLPVLTWMVPALSSCISASHQPLHPRICRTVDGEPHDSKRRGLYLGAISGLPLFRSEQKFESGTGWPSFWAPIDRCGPAGIGRRLQPAAPEPA